MEFERDRERERNGLKDRAEKNRRRAKKRLASNKAGERVGREMDGRKLERKLEKYEKGDGSPPPRNKKIIKLLIGGRVGHSLLLPFGFDPRILRFEIFSMIERERERERKVGRKMLKSRKIRGEGRGWTVRFLLVRLRRLFAGERNCAANGVTQLSHYWKLVTCTVPRVVTKAHQPPPTPSPSILSIAVPVASVTQLPDGSNYVVAVRSHPHPPLCTHTSRHNPLSLSRARSNFVLFLGPTYLRYESPIQRFIFLFYICPFVFPFPPSDC